MLFWNYFNNLLGLSFQDNLSNRKNSSTSKFVGKRTWVIFHIFKHTRTLHHWVLKKSALTLATIDKDHFGVFTHWSPSTYQPYLHSCDCSATPCIHWDLWMLVKDVSDWPISPVYSHNMSNWATSKVKVKIIVHLYHNFDDCPTWVQWKWQLICQVRRIL